jgi:hypothetical protein
MFKHTLSIALVMALLTAGSAWAEMWDGSGNPATVLTDSYGINSGTYNFDDEFTNGDLSPGIMTANGNGGGMLRKDNALGTRDEGWFFEWRSRIISDTYVLNATNYAGGGDDTNNWQLKITTPGDGTGTFNLLSYGASNVSSGESAPVANIHEWHTFRVWTNPDSDTMKLAVDGAVVQTLDVVLCELPGCDGGNLNFVSFAPSQIEQAIDYISWGAVPEPASLGLLSLGGLALLGRRRNA